MSSSCWVLFALVGSASALAQTPGASQAVMSAPPAIVQFGDKFQVAQRAPLQQTRIFVYRQANGSFLSPVNIYLQGRFHTALLSGGYTEFCAAPQRLAIQSVYDDAQKMHLGKEAPGQSWVLKTGQVLYLRVNETSSLNMPLLEVPAEQAKQELSRTASQVHVLSRAPAAQACDTPGLTPAVMADAAPVRQPPVPRSYALQTDALFEFGKTELKVAGYNAIEAMAQQLQRDFQQVERIRVVGHSDPIGKPKSNRTLSLARAEKVADQLRDRGVKPLQGFKTEGQGEDSLIKTDCPQTPAAVSKLCHAPNRRVEILVYGARN